MLKEYKGVQYIVFWNETGFFCGYVRIPDNHLDNKKVDKKSIVNLKDLLADAKGENPPHNKKHDMIIEDGYDEINIHCHGGLTFSKRINKKNNLPQGFSEGAWIGWDYAHSGELIKHRPEMQIFESMVKAKTDEILKRVLFPGKPFEIFGEKEWTEAEVEIECKNVIDQLLVP